MSVGIAYVDGPRLARSNFAAADWVAAGRDEINRINVFPVPAASSGGPASTNCPSCGMCCMAR